MPIRTYLANCWEYGLDALILFSFFLALFHILCEVVEQMVDNLGSEDFDFILFCELLSLRHHLDIEGEHTGIFFVSASTRVNQTLHCFQDVLLVDRSDVDRADWNAHLIEELEESFQGTNGRGLHADTILCLVDVLFKDVNQITFNLIDSILDLLFSGALKQL